MSSLSDTKDEIYKFAKSIKVPFYTQISKTLLKSEELVEDN